MSTNTGPLNQAVIDAAISWWASVRPLSWTAQQHVDSPAYGLNNREQQRLARAVAQLVGASIQTPPKTKAAAARTRQPELGDTTLVCGVCRNEKDLDEYPRRADRPGRRHTVCTPCRHARQKKRYLSVAAAGALAAAQIEFIIGEDDEVQGLRCTACEAPLAVGDHVVSEIAPRHLECPVR